MHPPYQDLLADPGFGNKLAQARQELLVAGAPIEVQKLDGHITIFAHVSIAAPFRLPDKVTERDLLAKYFRTLGNPTRLRILELLRERERPVGELVERLVASQPYVSNQLACLRWCGLVRTRRAHRTIYYRLADERVEQILALAQSLLSGNAEHVSACGIVDRVTDQP